MNDSRRVLVQSVVVLFSICGCLLHEASAVGINWPKSSSEPMHESASCGAVPKELRQIVLKARVAEMRGRIEEAISLYKEAYPQSSEHRQICGLICRKLIDLLWQHSPKELSLVESCLSVLESLEGTNNDMWNCRCRVLLRRLSNVPMDAADIKGNSDSQLNTWLEGFRNLGFLEKVSIHEATFKELDQAIAKLGAGRRDVSLKLLTDLFVTVPDIWSMRKLQWRRIRILEDAESWDEVVSAAILDILLASATGEGPSKALSRYEEIAEKAGFSAEAVECFKEKAFLVCRELEDDENNRGRVVEWADKILRNAAVANLDSLPSDRKYLRRRAFLHALSKKKQEALESMRKHLALTIAQEEAVADVVDEISIVMTLSSNSRMNSIRIANLLLSAQSSQDGEIENMTERDDALQDAFERILEELASGYSKEFGIGTGQTYSTVSADRRCEIIKEIRERFEQRAVNWGAEALHLGDKRLAEGFWYYVMVGKKDPSQISGLIDDIYEKARNIVKAETVLQALKKIEEHLNNSSVKCPINKKIATIHYELGQFEECLARLDEAEAAAGEREDGKDIALGFMRGLSLIHLKRTDDAIKLLGQMEQWPGNEEQHSRAVFLLGWANLKQNKKAEAMWSFWQVIDKYPNTRFADKARQLVDKLEGI